MSKRYVAHRRVSWWDLKQKVHHVHVNNDSSHEKTPLNTFRKKEGTDAILIHHNHHHGYDHLYEDDEYVDSG